MAIPDEWTMADIDRLVERGEVADLILVPIVITNLGTPDAEWSQSVCLALSAHRHPNVRANAVLGLGHLARVSGDLDRSRVAPVILQALDDPDEGVRGHAVSAAEDVGQFLGWNDFKAHPSCGYQDANFDVREAIGRRVEHFECFLDEADRPEKLIACLDGLGWHQCYLDGFVGYWSTLDERGLQAVREDYEDHRVEDIAAACSLRGRVVRRLACTRSVVGTQVEYSFDHGSLHLAEENPEDPDSPSVLRWCAAGEQGAASDLALPRSSVAPGR